MSSQSRNLLVTGGAGFIGSNFVHYWLKNHPQDQVFNLDALTYAGNLANLESIADNPHYHFIHGNITDGDLVDKILSENSIDTIVHFAAESHVDRSILYPDAFIKTNVEGTFILLQSALHHQIRHFHHISTDEVFGSLPLDSDMKFTLETAYDPRSPYSASKAASDHLVRAYGETYGLPYTISNCSNNYGPYQYPEKLFGLAITNLIEGKKIPVYGDGLNVRDWLYVEDHCRAIELILEAGPTGKTYLVGGLTRDISNIEAVQAIINLMGVGGDQPNSMIEWVKDRPGHDRRYAIDWSYLHDELGWSPAVTFEQGLALTIDFYRTHESWWRPLKVSAQGFFKQNYHSNNPD